MNAELVTILRTVNVLIALSFVLIGAVVGEKMINLDWLYGSAGHIAGGAAGAFLGLIAASVINGVVAAVLQIEEHLREIRNSLRQRSV